MIQLLCLHERLAAFLKCWDTKVISPACSCHAAICIHLVSRAGPVFVELVDDQRGVPIYHDAFNTELNGYTESVETCFIFDGVVAGRKMYPENISELILGRRDE